MARGGKRTYTRDANGRFASTPGGGSKSLAAARKAARPASGRKGTLQARTSLKKSRAKLAAKDPADQRLSTALSARAQKGAVTKGSKGLKSAKVAARTRISGGKTDSTIKSVVNKKPQTPSSKFRASKFKQPETMRGVGYRQIAEAKPVAQKQQVKPTSSRITNRSKDQQAKRDLIAQALKTMLKEKRSKFIKARKEIEAAQLQKQVNKTAKNAKSTDSLPSSQKQRWAQKAQVYSNAAARNREKALSLESSASRFTRDWNFISQPGSSSARRRVNKQQDKAFELRQKAKQQELKAIELRRLATTNKGDAERKRQNQRDAVSVNKGSRISTLLYGPGEVVRVNKKTVSYLSDQTGSVIKVDKSWIKNL